MQDYLAIILAVLLIDTIALGAYFYSRNRSSLSLVILFVNAIIASVLIYFTLNPDSGVSQKVLEMLR